MKAVPAFLLLLAALVAGPRPQAADAQVVETAHGRVEGVTDTSGIQVFKGLPYARPPVRDRRWKPPQPPEDWSGTRPADRFGPRCMQQAVYADMIFRSAGVSEDCLYLNVWTPEASPAAPRPVLVYFYGGGFIAGDGSEPRYDGASMARNDVVVVTLNYRLGVFGFLAHPELTAESPHGASGNYGLLDQQQALRWVQENIAAFGGDPEQVTIAGESAGSLSVSAQMASPLAEGLFDRAIGESGSVLGTLPPVPLAEAEEQGTRFARGLEGEALPEGDPSLEALRALSSAELLNLAARPDVPRFPLAVDGYFFPRPPAEVYAEGVQAAVPLLLGWNSQESGYQGLLEGNAPTPEHFADAVRRLYGDRAEEALAVYDPSSREEVIEAATHLASARFIGYGTWKWGERHRQTGAPVYRYFYAHPRPAMKEGRGNTAAMPPGGLSEEQRAGARGAVHSAEIEYALGNLATNDLYAWTAEDDRVSSAMQAYFANFIKTGNPNGPGLPEWPPAGADGPAVVMRLDADPQAAPATDRARYRFLDRVSEP